MKVLGVLLIVLGIVGLAYGGIRYTKREKVIDVGSIEASVDHHKTLPISPLVGAISLVAGLVLVTRRERMV